MPHTWCCVPWKLNAHRKVHVRGGRSHYIECPPTSLDMEVSQAHTSASNMPLSVARNAQAGMQHFMSHSCATYLILKYTFESDNEMLRNAQDCVASVQVLSCNCDVNALVGSVHRLDLDFWLWHALTLQPHRTICCNIHSLFVQSFFDQSILLSEEKA